MMKAPQNPTTVLNNPLHDKYVIQFAPELSNFIRKEGKTKTYRFGDKYDYLLPGDEVELREYATGVFISKAIITSKEKTTFGQLPLNLTGHEICESKEHQRKVFSSYYKYLNREISDDDPFLILSFKLK